MLELNLTFSRSRLKKSTTWACVNVSDTKLQEKNIENISQLDSILIRE
jgi:hypothetical protein